MALPSALDLSDWVMLVAFFNWLFAYFYPFILFNWQEEMDSEHQTTLYMHIACIIVFLVHGGFAHRRNRHTEMWNSFIQAPSSLMSPFPRLMRMVRNCIPQFLLRAVSHLHGFRSVRVICDRVNFALLSSIYCCCVVLLLLTFYNLMLATKAFTMYCQHFLLQVLYIACSSSAFRKDYPLTILINHLAYICLYVGYVCRCQGYEGSHYIVLTGSALLIVNVLLYFLIYPSDGGSGENPQNVDPPVRPRNVDPPVRPRNVDPSVRPRNVNLPVRPRNVNLPLRPRNVKRPVRPRNVDPPESPRNVDPPERPRNVDPPESPSTRRSWKAPRPKSPKPKGKKKR